MNFQTPVSALFPGASGRIISALTARRRESSEAPLALAELARGASVAATQLETTLFRLGLLGLIEPRARGEEVRPVPGHIVWEALDALTDLRGRVTTEARRCAALDLTPAPAHLALRGPVADGTAAHPADVLELVVVPPHAAPENWPEQVGRMAARLSRHLGNVVTVCHIPTVAEAVSLVGTTPVIHPST
ncbi:hypothetical protein [Streptomyces luteireticuli]|uniref:ArsR family transcriptional regulator n=1 Tax=Streptomyces luteireticuli TaxID=173858 RepID=A0ABN0YWW9_9ACTN